MKGKRVIAGILLVGILAVTLAGCKNTDNTKEETEPVDGKLLVKVIHKLVKHDFRGNNNEKEKTE